MANPALAPKRINATLEELEPGWASPAGPEAATQIGAPPAAPASTRTMTVGGTFARTAVLWVLLVAAGAVGWNQVDTTTAGQVRLPGWAWVSVFVALGFAFLTIFKPKAAPISAPLYAIAEGLFLGVISKAYDEIWHGIALQAILATMATFAVCLVLYSLDIVKVTQKFRFVVIGATFGIFVMYALTALLSLFGVDAYFWAQPSALGIGISVVICIVAALNLFLDFDMIRRMSLAGAPKSAEWYGAFGITVTIVWLYLEILRLLSYLRN
jgi:uncharacterized YccA/Bax inhibitor family protein